MFYAEDRKFLYNFLKIEAGEAKSFPNFPEIRWDLPEKLNKMDKKGLLYHFVNYAEPIATRVFVVNDSAYTRWKKLLDEYLVLYRKVEDNLLYHATRKYHEKNFHGLIFEGVDEARFKGLTGLMWKMSRLSKMAIEFDGENEELGKRYQGICSISHDFADQSFSFCFYKNIFDISYKNMYDAYVAEDASRISNPGMNGGLIYHASAGEWNIHT